jgi:hypothetical protein
MPLYSIDGDLMQSVPHDDQFRQWKAALTAQKIQAIDDALGALVDQKLQTGENILTSSWVPSELCHDGGHEWFGTPFFSIWEKSCRQNWEHTGWCFGLFLWEHMMNREEDWCFYKSDDGDIRGTTYFIRRPRN